MATPNLSVFKYDHDDRLVTPLGALGRILVYLAVVALFIYVLAPFGLILIVVGIVVLIATWPKRRLCLGTRYLLCGNTVVYYADVRKMVLRSGQALVLQCGAGDTFTLEWDRFPTNARKDAKITKNKAAKFEKVSSSIIRRVLLAAPEVECLGIDRARYKVVPS